MKTTLLLFISFFTIISCSSTKNQSENEIKKPMIENSDIVPPSFYQEKFLRGVDLFARGNEPFWVLEFDLEKSITFEEMNGLKISTPAVKGIESPDGNETIFHSMTESGELKVTIFGEKCQDSMSGEEFDYNVKVEYRSSMEKDFKTFTGCGKYLYDYRLHDIWVMEEITGIELKKENLPKGLPMFEFYPGEKRFSGHAGCNQILGGIEVKRNSIRFGVLVSTKMACPDMSIEQKVSQMLNEKTLTYRLESDLPRGGKNPKLILESEETGEKIIFRKID